MAQKQPLYTLLLAAMWNRAPKVLLYHQVAIELMELGDMLKNASDISETQRPHISLSLRKLALTLPASGDTQHARAYLDELIKEFD